MKLSYHGFRQASTVTFKTGRNKPTGNGEHTMARSTLARHRTFSFDRTSAEGGGGGTPGTEGAGKEGDKGTPPKTFTQEDLDRIVGERLNRQKAQFADYDELKTKAAEAETLRKQVETDAEKAVREARETAVAEARKRLAPQLVGAEFRAAAKGVLTDAQRDAFLEDADLTKYLTSDGKVDVDKVTKKVEALAPAKSDKDDKGGKGGRVPRDMGQGQREGGAKTSVSSAREDYLERRRKQLGQQTA